MIEVLAVVLFWKRAGGQIKAESFGLIEAPSSFAPKRSDFHLQLKKKCGQTHHVIHVEDDGFIGHGSDRSWRGSSPAGFSAPPTPHGGGPQEPPGAGRRPHGGGKLL